MSVPARRWGSARWDVIRYALGSDARTRRLCLILLAADVPVTVAVVKLAFRVPW